MHRKILTKIGKHNINTSLEIISLIHSEIEFYSFGNDAYLHTFAFKFKLPEPSLIFLNNF